MRSGFTLAEVLIALSIALVLTAATAAALTTVLRSERSQWQQRQASFAANSWLAGRYGGVADDPTVRLESRETGNKEQTWQWLAGEPEPGVPGAPTAKAWTRQPARGLAQ